MQLLLSEVASPLGTLLLVSDGAALRALDFHDFAPRMHRLLGRYCGAYTLRPAAAGEFGRRVENYFAGDMTAFDAMPVVTGGTAFQRRVWAELREIPPGATTTYSCLATRAGRATASRAVGLANGANPVAIAVPCHRVIGADARLTGYGGGLARKAWLIAHERQYAGSSLLQPPRPGPLPEGEGRAEGATSRRIAART